MWAKNWQNQSYWLDGVNPIEGTSEHIPKTVDVLIIGSGYTGLHASILKPLYGNGGAGVFLLKEDDRNMTSLHELFSGFSREPLIVQKFLPDVSNGTTSTEGA